MATDSVDRIVQTVDGGQTSVAASAGVCPAPGPALAWDDLQKRCPDRKGLLQLLRKQACGDALAVLLPLVQPGGLRRAAEMLAFVQEQ